jgi:UDP-N-acetylmuramate dehydrogenase
MNMTEPNLFISAGLRGTLRHHVDMSRHTSWRAGGYAEQTYQPVDLEDLAAFLRALPVAEPLLVVGLGSNLLVRDGGVRGTVLLLHGALDELRVETEDSISPQGGGSGCKAADSVTSQRLDGIDAAATTTLYAQAGVAGAKLARYAALHNLGGAEFFAGIPGTVGGMLAMNAGCYGSETWGVTARVQVMNRSGSLSERTVADYEIGYRRVVKRETKSVPATLQQEEFFVGAWFKFSASEGNVSREKIKELLAKRLASQPLNLPNAGSVFRNPAGDYAARLIESCGLKGKQIGGAQVSQKHANFIVNVAKASAADIEKLINEVQAVVEQKTGIKLHPEIRIVGEAA